MPEERYRVQIESDQMEAWLKQQKGMRFWVYDRKTFLGYLEINGSRVRWKPAKGKKEITTAWPEFIEWIEKGR